MRASTSVPLRIAILGTRGIPANYGGFETFAEQLSVRLAARGHQVTVYGRSHHVDRALDGSDYRGVRIRSLPTIRHKYFDTIVHAWLSSIDCVRTRYDVVLMCNAANSLACLVPRWLAIKVAVNVDGIERRRRKWNRIAKVYYRLGEWCAVRIADAVVADAEVVAAYYRERHHATPVVIPYGGDLPRADNQAILERWRLRANDYVLYVSRLEPENNADVVIRAFRELKTSARLVIVGDAPYADAYIRRLRELAAPDARIVFTGYQFGEAYHVLQQHSSCYVQATEVGGTHPALVEAMGAGRCVIANATPENLEVVGDAGLSYRRNDSDDLRGQLQRVLADPALAAAYGKRAADRVAESYNWDAVTSRYEELFRSLVAGKQPARRPDDGRSRESRPPA
jgi:glycosyltransferase involved in cell wall biosynthesis